MKFSDYVEGTVPDTQRTPVDTVVEFVKIYNKWAKYCHHMVKGDRSRLAIITRLDSEERKVLKEIYEKYCTPKNRQYHRVSEGYFFYGGTYNSSSIVENCVKVTDVKMEIQTEKIKNISQTKRYTVLKQGQVWKIDSVGSLVGNNDWGFDIL